MSTPVDHELHIPWAAVWTAMAGVVSGLFLWLVRTAAKQTLEGFQRSLAGHTDAIALLAREVAEHRKELAETRVEVAEARTELAGFRDRLRAIENFAHGQHPNGAGRAP
jgi:hypothetical protein